MARDYGITNAAPYASAPAVGAVGATYFNTTSKTLFISDGTAWVTPPGGAPSGSAAGDLSGSYPSPAVAKVNGAALGATTPLARGDLLVANATPALARLAKGAANTVLSSDGTDAVWAVPSLARAIVERSTTQSINTGTWTAIIFATEVVDTGNFWVVGSPDRFTIPTTGTYMIEGFFLFQGTAPGNVRTGAISTGTVANFYTEQNMWPGTTVQPAFSLAATLQLTAGTVVFLSAWHDAGVALLTGAYARLSIVRVG